MYLIFVFLSLLISISWRLSSKKDVLYTGSWLNRSVFGKAFLILDAKALIHDFFVYENDLLEWDKKTTYLVGIEGSGKTNFFRFKAWVLNSVNVYVENGLVSVATNDLRILGDRNFDYLFDKETVLNLDIDDAIGAVGTNSSEFNTTAGIDLVKNFVKSRHLGKEHAKLPVGLVFMTFATQSYMKLNNVIRENAKLKIFTSYIDEKYFIDMFPIEEAEFIQGKYHEAHISSNWRERKYAICRTGAGGIATLEIPFVPSSQEELDWCKRKERLNLETGKLEPNMNPNDYVDDIIRTIPITCKEDFLKHKSERNVIFQVDRSIKKEDMINRMTTYLRTHPDIQYLMKYHPRRKSLEDFSRGKLKGILAEEARRIEKDFCVSVKKEDMISAIDGALKEEEHELVEKIKRGEISFGESEAEEYVPKTYLERIQMSFHISEKKILHISEISSKTNLDVGQVKDVLSQNKNTFVNIIRNRGYWCLASNIPSKEELKAYIILNKINTQPKNQVVSTLNMEVKA